MNNLDIFDKYSNHNIKFEYGTSGFRDIGIKMENVVMKCSMIMSIRTRNTGLNCGIMITASHNKAIDNGVKLIDYSGEMINEKWEKIIEEFVNISDKNKSYEFLENLIKIYPLTYNNSSLIIGYDTRSTNIMLYNACLEGAKYMNNSVINMNLTTTPELHYYVALSNTKFNFINYTDYLLRMFKNLYKFKNHTIYHIDCANGVVATKLNNMKNELRKLGIHINLYNVGEGELNYKCGSDYVEKEKKFPINMYDIPNYSRCFSYDGDGDRLVSFTKINEKFVLLDGDRIAVLFASLFKNIDNNYSLGFIQTAYANGASTNYIKNNFKNFSLVCTKTGVKNLHKEAHKYDISIYFEANGHGSIQIKKNINNEFIQKIRNLINQLTGDAIGDMLLCIYIIENILSFEDWINLYQDYPCIHNKLKADRSIFKTTDADRICIEPVGLQDEINKIVLKYNNSRAFIRPSGTEDIVRLYAEAETKEEVENLMQEFNKICKF